MGLDLADYRSDSSTLAYCYTLQLQRKYSADEQDNDDHIPSLIHAMRFAQIGKHQTLV